MPDGPNDAQAVGGAGTGVGPYADLSQRDGTTGRGDRTRAAGAEGRRGGLHGPRRCGDDRRGLKDGAGCERFGTSARSDRQREEFGEVPNFEGDSVFEINGLAR